jgi:hypothetical protein
MFVWSTTKSSLDAEELTSGTASRQARQQAIQSIPYQQLTAETQAKINEVVQKPSIYRRLPVTSINVDPDYFVFLTRHPEVIVNIWKIMGVTKMSTTRTGPFTLRSDDGVGTISNVELVYGTNDMHIFYGTGSYEGPVLKRKLFGECVLILRSNYQTSATGKPTATSQLDVFLKIENVTVGMVAKTLNPVVGPTADHNFVESLNFLQRLNETTETNGIGVQRMANRLTDISADTREKFIQVAGLVYERNGGQPETSTSQPAPPTINFSQPGVPTSSYSPQNFNSNAAAVYQQPSGYSATMQTGYAVPQNYHYPGAFPESQPSESSAPSATRIDAAGYPPPGFYQQPNSSQQPNSYQQPPSYLPPIRQQVEPAAPGGYQPYRGYPESPRTSQVPYLAPAYPEVNYYQR